MSTARRKWVLPIAALAVLTLIAAAYVIVTQNQDAKRLSAYFGNVAALIPGNTVRANGVQVGEVEDVELVDGHARVEMKLDASSPPLHQDASAKIRPVSLLGERYVSLDTGSDRAPLMASPPTIPIDRTSASVDLDDVLNELDTPTSQALGALVTTLGEGVGGNGRKVAGAVKALEPAMNDTSDLASILGQQNALLDNLIDKASPVAASVARNDGQTLNQVVDAAQRTFAATAANRTDLRSAVAALPGTLRDVRETLQQLGGVSDSTIPVLRSARPVTDNLSSISRELNAFSRAGGPALASLRPVLAHADRLLDQARPVVTGLRAGSPNLREIARDARPLGTTALDNLDNLLKFITGWSLATAGYDAIGHFFRASVPIDSNTLKIIAPDFIPPALLGDKANDHLPARPGQEGTAQAGAGGSAPPPSGGAATPGNGPPGGDLGSATGLNQHQEQSLLGELLGGG